MSRPPGAHTLTYRGVLLTAVLVLLATISPVQVFSASGTDSARALADLGKPTVTHTSKQGPLATPFFAKDLPQPPSSAGQQLSRLAFVRGRDIWARDLPDGEARRLTEDGRNDTPLWSPSGEWIAFQKQVGDTLRELWVIRGSGTEAHRVDILDSGREQRVAWSPTADQLAFISAGGLFVENADGSGRRQLVAQVDTRLGAGVQSLAWSLDGGRLAYSLIEVLQESAPPMRFAALFRIDADGSNATELFNAGRPSEFGFIVAGWSPDSSRVLFWTIPAFSESILADGTSLNAVSASGGAPSEITEAMLARHDFLAFSPDGQRLALVDGSGRETWANKAIAVVAPLADGLQRLSDPERADLYPSWSPDGGLIAFTSGPALPDIAGGDEARRAMAQRRIWVMRADGTAKRALTDDANFRDERPRWSADGTFILFARLRDEQAQLWLMSADGSERRQVVDELTPSPGSFGFFGYLNWAQLYDFLPGRPAAPPLPFEPAATWFFAEGSTQPPFDTWFLVQNPTSQTAKVRFTFQLQGGGVVTRDFTVGPNSRFSLFANQVLPNQAFSTRIDSDQAVFAERAMFVSFDGTVSPGVRAPGRVWLFAEGSTQDPFHAWLLLMNPNSEPATATITYLLEQGGPVTQSLLLPPTSRTSVFVNQVLPNAAFSSRVESDLPIVAERAMFRFPGNAAMAKPGVNRPSRTWFFADGQTAEIPRSRPGPVDTWLLLQNPRPNVVTVNVTLFSAALAREQLALQFTLPPQSRQSFFLSQFVGDEFGSFGIRVQADDAIIAERSVFFGNEPRGAYSAVGSPELATTWHLPEGAEAEPFNELIHILNPNNEPADVSIDFLLPDGRVVTRPLGVLAQRKLSVSVSDTLMFQPAEVSAVVRTSVPTVVERTMFIFKQGTVGAHNTVGIAAKP